jgi:DNA polymerase-3 subunit gamma/tau
VRYASVGGKKKVYIIDEVHMLTQEAFNALLKTLEEPPSHVVFVFATTQPLKVPQTIVSRCQRFDFRRIPASMISDRLKQVCDTDGYKCDETALALIAQRAEGSMRDAQSMLEQVLAFSGGSARDEDIGSIMGFRGSEAVSKIAGAVIAGDEAKVLNLMGEAFDGGVDPLDLVASLTEWIRFLLIASIDPKSRELLSLTEETRKNLVKMVKGVSTEHLLSLLSMIADAENNIKRASHQRYLLETVVLRMAHVKAIARVSDIVEMLKRPGAVGGSGGGGRSTEPKGGTRGTGAGPSGKTSASGPTPAGASRKKAGGPKPEKGKSAGGAVDTLEPDMDMSAPGQEAAACAAQSGDVIQSWQDVIEHLRETKIGLASILDLCEPPKLSEGVYWINVPSQFHQSQVRKGQNMRILTEHVQKITNTSVTLKTRVKAKEDPIAGSEPQTADAAEGGEEVVENRGETHPDTWADPAPGRAAESRPGTRKPAEPQAADIASVVEKDPVVRALVENLGGKVVGIRRRNESPQGESTA